MQLATKGHMSRLFSNALVNKAAVFRGRPSSCCCRPHRNITSINDLPLESIKPQPPRALSTIDYEKNISTKRNGVIKIANQL